jgi:hypothetical protein
MFDIGPSSMKKKKPMYQDSSSTEKPAEKKSPTKSFEDAAKATEGLRSNLAKMGERKKAEDEEKKKKEKAGVGPQKGFIGRMIDKYWYGKE